MLVILRVWALVGLLLSLTSIGALADSESPRMGIFTKPNARVDLTRSFVDAHGETAPLGALVLPERPFILVPVFYKCPRLCGLTVSGVVALINQIPLALGRDYSVVFYSFNPDDTSADATEKRVKTVKRIEKQPVPPEAIRFLTTKPGDIAAINEELGFRVRYADKELEHSSAIFLVAPNGTVLRYFAGIEFNPGKVAAVLREATPKAR